MMFESKEEGHFFDIFDPPPTPLRQKAKKVGFMCRWGYGGFRTKNSLGDTFIGVNNHFTRR